MANANKDKNVRLERHSAGKTPAYGDSSVRAGTGKYNWGNTADVSASDSKPVDTKDPMYDSDIDKNGKREKSK